MLSVSHDRAAQILPDLLTAFFFSHSFSPLFHPQDPARSVFVCGHADSFVETVPGMVSSYMQICVQGFAFYRLVQPGQLSRDFLTGELFTSVCLLSKGLLLRKSGTKDHF
jgi:non-ribosomal peptide synthetase component F